MAKKNDGQWKEPGSGFDGCGWEAGGCLLDILLTGIRCGVPTLLFVACIVGVGGKTNPVKRIGVQMIARVQKLRIRSGKLVRPSSAMRLKGLGITFS